MVCLCVLVFLVTDPPAINIPEIFDMFMIFLAWQLFNYLVYHIHLNFKEYTGLVYPLIQD